LLEEESLRQLVPVLRQIKEENENVIDIFLFRDQPSRFHYEHRRDGLLFAEPQSNKISPENIRDINLVISTLPLPTETTPMNGDINGKRAVSLPGLNESWDAVVQTSSNLFSTLSFGTLPARRSPLSASPEPVSLETKVDEGRWIIGGEKEGLKVWLEGNVQSVPISLGNERPEFYGEDNIDDDGLVEMEISIYKVVTYKIH
jgi:hypothetical protein